MLLFRIRWTDVLKDRLGQYVGSVGAVLDAGVLVEEGPYPTMDHGSIIKKIEILIVFEPDD